MAGTFLLFWPTLHWSPFSDDHSALWNTGVGGIPWRNGSHRPLSDLTFRLGYLLGGTSAEVHRAFNVVLHGTNGFLLFELLRRWAGQRAGLLAAALFLVYPFHQESVVWLVGRESALGTLAILLGLVLGGTGLRTPIKVGLMALVLLLGVLCYESALLLLPLAVLVAWSQRIPGWPGIRPILVVLGSAVLGWVLWRSGATDPGGNDYIIGLLPHDVPSTLLRIPKVAGRLFLPPEPDPTKQLLRAAVLGVTLFVFAHFMRGGKGVVVMHGLPMLLVLLTILASAVAIGGGVSTVTSESDRYLYLPSAFLCGVLAIGIDGIGQQALRVALATALLVLSFVLLRQNHANWDSASRITRQCVARLPPEPEQGSLWVGGLPDSHGGAYIFRNGFPEAAAIAGKAGDRIVVVPSDANLGAVWSTGLQYRGTMHQPAPEDTWFWWDSENTMWREMQ